MANRHNIAIALPVFFAVATAHAASSNPITDANSELSFSVGSHNIAYHEMFDQSYRNAFGSSLPQYPDSVTGSQPAVSVGLSRQWDLTETTGLYQSASLMVAHGGGDYTSPSATIAALGNGDFSHPLSFRETGTTVNLDWKIGPTYRPSSNLQFTPFLAYGFHLWHEEPYSNRWQHAVSLGLMAQYALTPSLVLSESASVGRTFGVRTHNSFDDNTFKQQGRFTPAASASLDYAFTRHTHLIVSYQVARYSYGQSESHYGTTEVAPNGVHGMGELSEPASRLTEQTVMVGYAYSW